MAESARDIRAFIAIDLPDILIEKIESIQIMLGEGVGKIVWVRPENAHITLKFLSSIDVEHLEKIYAIMAQSANCTRPFTIHVKGVACFPSMKNPRVIWLGVDNKDIITGIYKMLEDGLYGLGFKKEERKFYPHITIGRVKLIKDRASIERRLEAESITNVGSFDAESIALFRSDLRPVGVVYTKLKEVKFRRS